MSYCIATVIGFVLGAVCVIGTMLFKERDTSSASQRDTHSPQGEGFLGENPKKQELLYKQWENFLNYDGSDKDQMSIGDE